MDRSRDPVKARRVLWQAYCVFATVYVLLVGYQAYRNSLTHNERAHLAAGVSHLTFQRFDLYRVNPPLVRSVAAIPVALAFLKTDWDAYRFEPTQRCEIQVGGRFAELNSHRFLFLLALARWVCIPFSLVGGWICGRWATRLYGLRCGILAMLLWFFSPMLTGHVSLITPDAHATALAVCAMYCIWNWLNRPGWENALGTGLVLGLAELTKFTLLVLYPVTIFLWAVYWSRTPIEGEPAQPRRPSEKPAFRHLIALLLLSVLTINLGYGFEGTFKTLGDYRFQTQLFTGLEGNQLSSFMHGEKSRFANTVLGSLPIPLPANYVQGIDTQRYDFEQGLPSYLRGDWSDHGWWYYYLYALAIKMPLGTWCLMALAVGVTIFGRGFNAPWRDEMVVLVPGLVILLFVSSQTGFSVHSRYVIPALPFFFVWISKVARVFEMTKGTDPICPNGPEGAAHKWGPSPSSRAVAAMVVVALTWSVGSSLWAYPHSLSYFNELVGGPRNGGKHLLDSNIDWGQDLLYLKDWLDEHPDVKLNGLALFDSYPATLAGIPETPHPPPDPESQYERANRPPDSVGPKPGWYALSVNNLYDRSRQFRYFFQFKPVASAGYSIYIYRITLDDANCVRRALGLPELPAEGNEYGSAGDWDRS